MLNINGENYHFSFIISEDVKKSDGDDGGIIYYAVRLTRNNCLVFWFINEGKTIAENSYLYDEVLEYLNCGDWVLQTGEYE